MTMTSATTLAPADGHHDHAVTGDFRYSPGVVFGPWQPLDSAPATAPSQPGVLQIRGDALVELPRGKTAMLLYAASAPDQALHEFVTTEAAPAIGRAVALGARYIRFALSARPQEELARLLANFDERFGALPPAHAPRLPHRD
jgi:hypothetical protein